MLKKHYMLQCLFLEMNGNLAQWVFKAGNEMPALIAKQCYPFSCRVAQRTRSDAAATW